MNKTVIVDYDAGNLRSVANMLTFLNVPFLITSDKDEILNAQRIIFPGQGHFAQAMNNLDKKGLRKSLTKSGNSERGDLERDSDSRRPVEGGNRESD